MAASAVGKESWCRLFPIAIVFFFGGSHYSPRLSGIILFAAGSFFILIWSNKCEVFAERTLASWEVAIHGINPGMFFAIALIGSWWRKQLWVGENGITFLAFFRSWERINNFRALSEHNDVVIFEYQHAAINKAVAIRVPPEFREDFDTLIAQKLSSKE